MASWISSQISFLISFFWPPRNDDVSVSQRILQPLSLRPSTKKFSFALRPTDQSQSVVYILPVVLLSEQSAYDTQDLIQAVKPGAVIVQIGSDALDAIHIEHQHAHNNPFNSGVYPTSALHVITESFYEAANHVKYTKMAQADVLKAVLGTSFTGYLLSAKRVAKEVKSSFYYLESFPYPIYDQSDDSWDSVRVDTVPSAKNLVSLLGSSVFSNPAAKTLSLSIDSPGLKFIASHIKASVERSLTTASTKTKWGEHKDNSYDVMNYECPAFAETFYPFLVDLHGVFKELPGMDDAFEMTQKLLKDVEKGNPIADSELSLSRCFRLAVECLRISLCKTAHAPLSMENSKTWAVEFDDLTYEDKCHVLLVQALKQQAKQHKSVVAILDAGSLAGVRKYWTASVPDHVVAMAQECLVLHLDDDEDAQVMDEEFKSKTRMIGKPIIVVSAGAAAAVGVASLSHWAPVSTAMKILSFKVPLVVKLIMLQTKKGTVVAMSKLVNPVANFLIPYTKVFGAGKVASGSKVSVLKAVGSTGKIRGAAHSVIATAEKASFSAIRTAFYNAMRNQHRTGVRAKPWVSFGVSVAACVGLLTYGEGIENVIETLPQAASIARLCRGVNNLCLASSSLRRSEDPEYWENTYNQLYSQSSWK